MRVNRSKGKTHDEEMQSATSTGNRENAGRNLHNVALNVRGHIDRFQNHGDGRRRHRLQDTVAVIPNGNR